MTVKIMGHEVREGSKKHQILLAQKKHFEDLAKYEQEVPPIAGQADVERGSRLDAERVTLEFGSKSTRKIDAGRRPIDESPLFGGEKQESLF